MQKRAEILATGGIRPLQASMENNSRQGDLADQASGNNEVHIALKLKQTDAKILQAIEEALAADRQGHLRRLPRLRRADLAGPAERHPVDPRLHHLQGKAELVKPADLLVAAPGRSTGTSWRSIAGHEAGARRVSGLRVQQHLPVRPRREDTHLEWLRAAIEELGGHPDESAGAPPCPRPARAPRPLGRPCSRTMRARPAAFVDRVAARGWRR